MDFWEKRRDFTPYPGVHFPSEPVSQYIFMKLPKTDDIDRTHKNNANTLSWHMVNASFQTSAPWKGHSISTGPSLDMTHLRFW